MSDDTTAKANDALFGRLVVVPTARARGVGRFVACIENENGPMARVFFYDDGTWGFFARDLILEAPPGVWRKEEP
jgi:hypothetical protein